MNILTIFKEKSSDGQWCWSFRRVTGSIAVVCAIICAFIGRSSEMIGLLSYAGSCGVSIAVSEVGKNA